MPGSSSRASRRGCGEVLLSEGKDPGRGLSLSILPQPDVQALSVVYASLHPAQPVSLQ